MKSIILALSLVAAATAQDVASLAQCGQLCANNMMTSAKAQELGCAENNLKCLCSNPNFMYGLRDCSQAVCDTADAQRTIEFGIKICQGAGVAISGGEGSGGASQSAGEGSQATTIYSTMTNSDGSVATSAIATSTIANSNSGTGGVVVTTSTTNGSQVVMTLTTMTSNPASSGITQTGSGSTVSSATQPSESSGSHTTTESAQTSSSKGFAAQITAAPGMLAVAGLAALLI